MAKNTMLIENANIFWLNFAGQERQYNPAGRRNFCVDIDEELAQQLISEGWNVKVREPRDEGEVTKYHIQVELRYNPSNPIYDPEVFLKVEGESGARKLREDELYILDDAEITNVDLEINPHDWGSPKNGVPAIKAYVKRMGITIQPNLFDIKYATNPEMPF